MKTLEELQENVKDAIHRTADREGIDAITDIDCHEIADGWTPTRMGDAFEVAASAPGLFRGTDARSKVRELMGDQVPALKTVPTPFETVQAIIYDILYRTAHREMEDIIAGAVPIAPDDRYRRDGSLRAPGAVHGSAHNGTHAP